MPNLPFAAAAAGTALVLAALALAGAPGATDHACSQGTVSRLYLGQSTPAGVVTEAERRDFVAQAVTPRFPGGFTEVRAHGRWRDERAQSVEEATRIVEIAHDDAAPVHERVRAIAADHRRRFAQQSVLVTQSRAVQCFDNGV